MLRKARLTLALVSFVVAVFLLCQNYSPVLAVSPAGRDLIRLHIIAHSDCPEDQALKLKVRDAIIEKTGHLFNNVSTEQEAERRLRAHLDQIEEIARQVVTEADMSYDSHAEIGIYSFPERAYQDKVLPAGYYRALRIVLGDGQGSNWWCVLFPPLCFVSGSSGQQATPVNEVPSDMNDEAQRVMATGNTQLSGQEETVDKIEVRFKVAEVWEKVRPRARELFSWRQEE